MTIQELADRAEVTTRTIRYYVEQGVLPPPERGRPAEYTNEHIVRLALIKRLKEQYLPLEEIRDTMQRLSLAEVEALVEQHSVEQTTQKLDSAADYITRVLGRGVAREQMKQAVEPKSETTELPDTEALKREITRPGKMIRERESAGSYPVPQAEQIPPSGFVSAPGAAAAPLPPPSPPPVAAPAPSAAPAQAQPHAPSLATRLWSSVVGRRSSETGTNTEESAHIQPPTAWQRIQLGEGVELHYHVSSDAGFNERVRRLIDAAHIILDREPGNGE